MVSSTDGGEHVQYQIQGSSFVLYPGVEDEIGSASASSSSWRMVF